MSPDPNWPISGPLHEKPSVTLAGAQVMMRSALQGLDLGAWDQRVISELTLFQRGSELATIASIIRRAWEAGVAAGRAEIAEERKP